VVKFLSGTSYDGSQVPTCAYWSKEAVTDINEDFAELESQANLGRCIANHYFARADISCFDDGQCNGEGKCLPCTKYKYGAGMRMGISHSPPLEFFREFNKGLTDNDLVSPQLQAGGAAVQTVYHSQMPFHIILRNIQAEIAKCCRWSGGDGKPSEFVITTIIDGPDEIQVTGANGGVQVLKGIRVKNDAFPQDRGTDTNPEGGSFFPVGLAVVAGWRDAPSFYLEPRTGLVKPGEGVVFRSQENSTTVNSQAKSLAPAVPRETQAALDAIAYCKQQRGQLTNSAADFLNSVLVTSAPEERKDAARASYEESLAAYNAIVAAEQAAQPLANAANTSAQAITAAETTEDIATASKACATSLRELAAQVDIANTNAGGQPASDTAALASRRLNVLAQSLEFAGQGGSTKCELALTEENSAAQWNSPSDGSLPCNGMRSDCPFYTGPEWKYATTEKMEMGQKITAEAIQEIRYYSDDWARYSNPEEEFNNRFTAPFIWAYKDFINVGGTPDPADMLLYRPAVMLAREKNNPNAPDDNPDTLPAAYETMRVDKVGIGNFSELAISKTTSRILPGQEDLDTQTSTPYATTIRSVNVPEAVRLSINHPPRSDTPFIYRSWTPEFTNRISLFGSATPSQQIYIVNNTALQNRQRYHQFFDSQNMFEIPESLPGANSNFAGILSLELQAIFENLAREKVSNQSPAVLGFDSTTSNQSGFWESRVEVDLVHNAVNDIFVFILTDALTFIFDSVKVDCRVLHSVVKQDTFEGTDFTINDRGGKSTLGIAIGDLKKKGQITASTQQILGSEAVSLDYGYYAWRFKDRSLRFSNLNAGSDLQSGSSTSGDDTSFVTESDASAFITSVSYRVVQYRKTVNINNWYLLDNCGTIMVEIPDTDANRVLPLPNQQGEYKALSPVLVNNGATGSVVAQWAPEKATLRIGGESKDLVLLYRNEEGIGLPANYAIFGPGTGVENLFGRPDPDRDSITVQFTYLRAQTHKRDTADSQTSPESNGEVVNDNFYGDTTRDHTHSVTFAEGGLVAGGDSPDAIGFDQQDYVFVFKDSENRPIGKKNVRFMVVYSNIACVSVEIFYAWRSDCTTYGLFPDLFLATGGDNGTVSIAPKGTINPDDLTLGHLVAGQLGPRKCSYTPNCGDHEILRLGPLREEFETIVNISEGEGEDAVVIQKAVYPSAGQAVTGEIISSEPPGTQWQKKRGTLWYPYDVCEKPRYNTKAGGVSGNNSTELINETTQGAGVESGQFGAGTFQPGPGVQGGLQDPKLETHHTYDQVQAKILDVHSNIRPCTTSYTYGNVVAQGGGQFAGYARKRGEIDQFWYEAAQWSPPPFGNFGRPVLMAEISEKIGDYTPKAESVAFRWMPMFPEREDLKATAGAFSEELEPIHTHLIGATCPLGGIGEAAPTAESSRYTHKSLLTNRGGGGIEYPYAPYYPNFLPDSFLGLEPQDQGVAVGDAVPKGTITTAWAWRESDTPVRRGQGGTSPIVGMQFLLPDYFIDNRRLEVRLRPAEGQYVINYTAPEYDQQGAMTTPAKVKLGDGPERDITIDFVNRRFGPALMPDTVYDTSKILGDSPLDCTVQPSSNRQLANECSCEGNVADLPDVQPGQLPAIFIHGDQLAPSDYVTLYARETMEPAFPTDIPREDITDPCCICNYFIEQIWFRLDSTVLPVDTGFDPAYSNSLVTNYTWSRVPHGTSSTTGRDDAVNGQENTAQNYREKQGVLLARPADSQRTIAKTLVTAYFPSSLEASQNSIPVPGALAPGDPKLLGGTPVQNGLSQGQDERITLDFTFDTYASVKNVVINFLAGKGMEVPTVYLVGIPPSQRTGDFVTERQGILLGSSNTTAVDIEVPDPDNRYTNQNIQLGQVLFPVTIFPSYADAPFWDQFFQEFHLIFVGRNSQYSMGIHSIETQVDAMTATLAEQIFIPERRYYTSKFTPAGGKNPDENLTGMDSCSAYWRSTSTGADQGGHRFRAYAWGVRENQESGVGQGGGQPTIQGEVGELEQLQAEEYDKARRLMQSPYTFTFSSFFPLDEQNWMNFLGASAPSWGTICSTTISDIDKVSTDGSDTLLYGSVPVRSTWAAPGHAWAHELGAEGYTPCCEGCGFTQVIAYKYLHLHDDLAEVEVAGFWDDFSNGNSYAGIAAAAPSISNNPDVTHLETSDLLDSNGDPIPVEVLNASGFRRDAETGQLVIIEPPETPGGAFT
jgi:hypothetical protein